MSSFSLIAASRRATTCVVRSRTSLYFNRTYAIRHNNSAYNSPIPTVDQKTEINSDASKQREVQVRQHEIRETKKKLEQQAGVIAALDTLSIGKEVKYQNVVEAYNALLADMFDYLEKNDFDAAYDTLTSMRQMGFKLTKNEYDRVIQVFAKNKQIYKVRDIWDFMSRDKVAADQESYMAVVREYCAMNRFEWAQKTFLKMCESVVPTPAAYEETMELFAKDTHVGNLRKAEHIFYSIHRFDQKHTPKSCASFIRLLLDTGYEGDGDRAVEVLKFMKTKVIEPVPKEVYGLFSDHISKFCLPNRQMIRMKKILRGLQHGGLEEEPFNQFWELISDKKHYTNRIHRANLAAP